MDFAYSEDQQALQALAQQILSAGATQERVAAVEAEGASLDAALWAELAKANLIGACLPEACGGLGLGAYELCILLEEVGRCVAPVPLWAVLTTAALPLAKFGPDPQRKRWLPGVAAGETILVGALQEGDAVDPHAPSARAEADGSGWRISGAKVCVPAAGLAERLLVPARTAAGELGLYWVDPRGAGVALQENRATSREPLFTVTLAGVPVPEEDALATGPRAHDALQFALEHAITGLCALQLGVAERALRLTAEYTRDRKQFDRPIGSFQAVHQRAGDAYMYLEAMRLTTLQAAHRLAQGESAAVEAAVAKVWAADGGNHVCYAAQHLHGGIGMDVDYPLHRSYLWTRHIELMLGSAERHLEAVGRVLADAPAMAADY